MSQSEENIVRIITCGVFKPAIRYLLLNKRYHNLRVTYLPSVLHTRPIKLEKHLKRTIASAKRRDERIICLYGECCPDIDDLCQQYSAEKVPCNNCYEMLLGTQHFNRLLSETAGTYFLEKELILNFKEYCSEPLELDDEELRKYYFKHYKKLLYVRQPSDPDLEKQANEIADFLELSLYISDADYSHLDKELAKLL